MKLLINTQYKENYAWHNEDYVHGVSEPYWKYKGGSAYVLENVGCPVQTGDAYEMLHEYYPEVVDAISMSDSAQIEYIIDVQLLADSAPLAIEEWDNPYFINIASDGSITCERNIANGEFGWMRKEILSRNEKWTMGPKQAMNDYKVNFIMTDGSQLLGHKELEKYLVSKDNEVTGVAV
jgi:hypothetical protein